MSVRFFIADRFNVVDSGIVSGRVLTLILERFRVVEIGIVSVIVLDFRSDLFRITAIEIVAAMVRALKRWIVAVTVNGIDWFGTVRASILLLVRVVDMGIGSGNKRNAYLIRFRVVDNGIVWSSSRDTSFWINGMISRILLIEGKPYQGKPAHLHYSTGLGSLSR